MREILFRGKHMHVCPENKHLDGTWVEGYLEDENHINDGKCEFLIDPKTICQYTGLTDKNGRKIWENDILMGHGNREDLAKVVYGEFPVINAESLEAVDEVIGWHYEVVPTDALSKCEPFCLPMPLTEEYVKTCEFEVVGNVFDNLELMEV
nr:MAG TPA: YopX protein [Caudoviricetes sp.]